MSQTTEKRAYDHLRRKLAGGSLPPGSRVSAVAMAREIGVSATPVTQAIRRLEIEGLIELVPHLGTFVKKPDWKEIEDLYDLRLALETHAVARAVGRLSDVDLAELEGTITILEEAVPYYLSLGGRPVDADTLRRLALADLKFHVMIVHASGNRRIIKLMDDSHMLMRGMTMLTAESGDYQVDNLRDTAALHRRVLDAIRQGDRKAARKAMGRHLRDSIKEIRKYSRREGSQPFPPEGVSSVYDMLLGADRIVSNGGIEKA